MLVKNNTHYYTIFNKVYNSVPETNSWEFESSKRLSYGQRLYYEYRYCRDVGGQAFFYTFTYNDSNLPKFNIMKLNNDTDQYEDYSFACFNYEHIRLLTNGLISKVLRRKYGSQLRYFVASERGEGKGLHRMKGQNPHYHVIFFVFPLQADVRKPDDVPYKRISPIQFCHLCKSVWQYRSVHDRSYSKVVVDYKSARFGHCQPGDNLGLVVDFDALSYVAKYVVKDSVQSHDDFSVKLHYEKYFRELGFTWHSIYHYYQYMRYFGQVYDRKDFLELSGLDKYMQSRHYLIKRSDDVGLIKYLSTYYKFQYDDFWADFTLWFDSVYLPQVCDTFYRDYQNKYGSKVRCSKFLGIYGLNFVRDSGSNPHFVIDRSKGVVTQPISLYYYRKLYMNVEFCQYTGNPLYVLNERGLALKCSKLPELLDTCVHTLNDSLEFALSNMSNTTFLQYCDTYGVFASDLVKLTKHKDSAFLHRYSVYHCVYQYRHYSLDYLPALSVYSGDLDFSSVSLDYCRFLQSNYYVCDFENQLITTYVKSCPGLRSFDSHPVFMPYVDWFKVCDRLISCVTKFRGDLKRKQFSDAFELRRSINAHKYVS